MSNDLAAESSLYLRQHAENPVDWHAWNEAALLKARASGKPILLSIGYSACHWCHVMAHESFEDTASATLMNELYVNIKVDREERPDLDRIYQLAHQALTRRGGGWPLTVFLDPKTLLPFFAGTYFPKTPRYGMPSFTEVLQGVRLWWDEQQDQLQQQNIALEGFLTDYGRESTQSGDLSNTPLQTAREKLLASIDPINGGHRGAPKFPHAGDIAQLLALAKNGDEKAGQAAVTTLSRMADRGLHDHLAGGFFRYCVDERWDIPHFEKMLYDNAQLLPVYAEAALQFDSPRFRDIADGIVGWLQAQMRAEQGGFCSALDADSEGVEGKFYLWTREEFDSILDGDVQTIAQRHYGLDRPPNFEGQLWHLHAAKSPAELAAELATDEATVGALIAQARTALAERRAQRIWPNRDDKRLTAINALLCTGLARAGHALGREHWIDEAAAIFAVVLKSVDARGRLPAVIGSNGPGFLDEHAFSLQAAMTLLEVHWSTPILAAAIRLAETLLRDFFDSEHGGFFFTAHDHERLPQRPKPWLDDSTPSGNALAARALLDLGFLLAEPRYLDAAEATLRAAWTSINETPQAAASMLEVLREFRQPTPLVVIRGKSNAITSWQQQLRTQWQRPLRIYVIDDDSEALPSALASKPSAAQGKATLCRGMTCLASCNSVAELIAQLMEA